MAVAEIDGFSKYTLGEIIKEFQEQKKRTIEVCESFLTSDPSIAEIVRESLQKQLKEVSPELFQWLYECVSLKKKSSKLFVFVMQFVPDLLYLYLTCVSENLQKVKVPLEVLLLGITKEIESEKQIALQVPTLSRPSIYHQNLSSASQPHLTESALSRHDQIVATPPLPMFSNKQINAANRLTFLSLVAKVCTNSITLFHSQSQIAYCLNCTRLVISGMSERFVHHLTKFSNHQTCLSPDTLSSLCKSKRLSVSDDLLSFLLHGIRMCLFQSCHFAAKQSLQALKLRAEYDLLPLSLQISLTLERLANEIHPLRLPLDPEIHKTYSSKESSNWASRPSTVVRTFMGQILYHHLNPASLSDHPHDLSDERMSMDADDLLVSQSFDLSEGQPLEQRESKKEEVRFNLGKGESSDEDDIGVTAKFVDHSPSRISENGEEEHDDTVSPSGVTIVLHRGTPERNLQDQELRTSDVGRVNSRTLTNSMKTTEV